MTITLCFFSALILMQALDATLEQVHPELTVAVDKSLLCGRCTLEQTGP